MNVEAVIFDWAGTMIDHGSRAPMGAFVKVLSEFQVPISVAEARRLFGPPSVSLDQMIEWTAAWIQWDRPLLDKPTHYEARNGRF